MSLIDRQAAREEAKHREAMEAHGRAREEAIDRWLDTVDELLGEPPATL